jgi:hypothetical protein
MAPRFRLRPASGPRRLGGLAATVLAAALVLTGLLLPVGSTERRPAASPTRTTTNTTTQAPYRLGGRVECPPAWPVLAMSNRTSYPAGHPAKPPATAAAVACYQTTAKAASAGYAPAPLPAGALEVGGVYLTPTSRGFRAHCQQVADRVGFAVPCPGLLPTSPPGLAPPRLCQDPPICRRGQLVVFTQDFLVPFGVVGAPGGYGSLLITVTPPYGSAGLQCPGERPIATPTVQQTRAVLTTCQDDAPWVLGGSLRLRWSQQDTLVVVSVPGPSDSNQRLVITVADHLRLVRPTRG